MSENEDDLVRQVTAKLTGKFYPGQRVCSRERRSARGVVICADAVLVAVRWDTQPFHQFHYRPSELRPL